MIGDIPIYVSADSADFWAHRDLFMLDERGRISMIAGVPPDGFSADGQVWGNPLYDWKHHKETGYAWWKERIRKCLSLYDTIRIDHFRGFDEFFAVPAADKTAAGRIKIKRNEQHLGNLWVFKGRFFTGLGGGSE